MKLTIETCDNGYILMWREEDEKGEPCFCKKVIEGAEDDEKETMKRVLYAIAEHLGVNYDKWSGENLNIAWNKKGHKVD